jgi:anti-sigma factor RsiW
MPDERIVAGLRCSDVMERLSDYVDGELPPDARAQVEEHVRGCDWCERFGGEFASAVRALRERITTDLPDGARERLRRRLS